MSEIIAIANQKGGVGKTTTAINLSAALKVLGRKILLIDMDPQSNCTSGFGLNSRQGDSDGPARTIYDVLINGNLEGAIVPGEGKPDFIPSSVDLTGAEIELVDMDGREYRLREAVSVIKGSYDYIFIDCPPSLGLLTVNALTAADSILIPLQCEFYAMDGIGKLLNTLKHVRDAFNEHLRIKGVLLTMYDRRLNLTEQVAGEIKRFFDSKLYSVEISRNVRLAEAPSFGKDIFGYDKSSSGARNYMALARELLKKEKET